MNHPAEPWRAELRRIAREGFEFADLTLEPPGAWPVDGAAVGRELADLGLVNVHPDPGRKLIPAGEIRRRNVEAVATLAEAARGRGQRIMVENMPRGFAEADELRPLLDAAPGVGFHLDVGHAHLNAGRRERPRLHELLDAFSDRLAHVHVHDNLGAGDDLHLPLGAGTIEWPAAVRALRAAGWDGTVTLEVFSPEPEHARTSARLWRTWWQAA